MSKFKKGQVPWNKGRVMPKEERDKLSKTLKERGIKPSVHFVAYGKDHHLWKGNDVGYSGLHYWLVRRLGSPRVCDHCGSTKEKKYEWANKSRKYKRDITDWIRLCTSCHRKYDNHPWFKKLLSIK